MFTQQQPCVPTNSNSLPSDQDPAAIQQRATSRGYTSSRRHSLAAHSMPRVVMAYYHTFNEWFNKHLLERRAGHETV